MFLGHESTPIKPSHILPSYYKIQAKHLSSRIQTPLWILFSRYAPKEIMKS